MRWHHLSVVHIKTFLACKFIRFTHIWQFIALMFIEDFFFYWGHRSLHNEQIYKYVHKVHHEFFNTIAFSCFYAHWFEWIFGNILPLYISLYIFGNNMHVITFAWYSTWTIMETHYTHSGYVFPYTPFESPVLESNIISWFWLS